MKIIPDLIGSASLNNRTAGRGSINRAIFVMLRVFRPIRQSIRRPHRLSGLLEWPFHRCHVLAAPAESNREGPAHPARTNYSNAAHRAKLTHTGVRLKSGDFYFTWRSAQNGLSIALFDPLDSLGL